MPDRVIRTLVQFGFDESALKQLKNKSAEIRSSIEDTIARVKGLDAAGKGAAAGGLKQFDNVLEKNAARLRKTAEEVKNLTREITKLDDAGDASSIRAKQLDKVRLVGSQLRALPSMQIPGLGIGTDAVANIIRLIGNMENLKATFKEMPELVKTVAQAIGGKAIGLIGALGGLAIVAALVTAELERQAAAARKELDARAAAIKLLASGTQEEFQNRINELAKEKELKRIAAEDTQKLFEGIVANVIETQGLQALGLEESVSAVGLTTGAYSEARKAAVEARDAYNATTLEQDLLTQATGLSAQTTEQLTAAEAALTAERNRILFATSNLQNQLTGELQAYQMATTGTTEQIQKQNVDLQQQIAIYANYAEIARKKAIAEGLATESGIALTAQADEWAKKQNQLQTIFAAINQAWVGTAITAREASEYAEKQAKETADLVDQYNDDIAKAEADALEARANAQAKYNDALVKAAEQAAEAAADALRELRQKRDDLITDFGRDVAESEIKERQDALDRQIDFARDEAKAERDHAEDLLQIQRDSHDKEDDLIAARDFGGLFRLRRDTNRQIQESNRQHDTERRDRIQAYQEKNEDEARQAGYEAEARARKFQQANADLDLNYRRELEAIARNQQQAINAAVRARDTELAVVNSKYVAALSMLYNAVREELRIVAMGVTERIKLAQHEQNMLTAQARGLMGSYAPGAGVNRRAEGGSLRAGQWSTVNERMGQRESFNGMKLPGGAGMFFPMQSGMVNSNGGGATIAPVFNISGSDPQRIADAVEGRMVDLLEDWFG